VDSITKPTVTADQLERICEKHLGALPVRTEELKDGWFNAAYLLQLPDAKFALKIAPPDEVQVLRYEYNLMTAEVAATREVKAKTKLPLPQVVAFDQTREEVTGDYFITGFVEGVPLDRIRKDLTAEAGANVDRQIGTLLRELHSIQGEAFGTYNQPIHSTWMDAFGSLLEDLRRDQQDQAIVLPPDSFESATPHLSALSEVKSPALLHWDLWDPNIFIDPVDFHVTGLIDFERAMWADPLIEGNFMTPSAALLEGYEHPITQPPGASARRALYDLYLSLIMVIESTYRRFDADHEKSAREFLDRSIAALNALP